MEHAFADVGDVTLHYVTAGDGVPIVLLHGFPQTWYCWSSVIPLLVERGFRCIVPDLRGLGDSSRPTGGYDKRTLAADVHTLVVDRLGIDRFAVVGHDWGGVVAFALAARPDSKVACLGVVDVAIPGDGRSDISQGGRRWHHPFFRTADLPEALITGREETLLRWFYENYGDRPTVIDEDAVREYVRTYSRLGAMRAGLSLYRALDQDIADNEGRDPLGLPVLTVGGGTSFGRRDEVEDSLRRMATDVTGHVFDHCGHWVPEEKPVELATVVADFVHARW